MQAVDRGDLPDHPCRPLVSPGLAITMVVTSVASMEVGGSLGKGLFVLVPPTTAAWLRFGSAFGVQALLKCLRMLGRRVRHSAGPPGRPPVTRGAIWLGVGYVISLVAMNWTFYLAIARLQVGIVVTIEFLGPLAVAIAGSRQRIDLLWVALAGLGVALLGIRPAPLDPVGIVFTLLAALCWGGYIVLGSRASRHWEGGTLVTAACLAGTAALAVPAVCHGGPALWTPAVLGLGVLVGVLSSVLPYRLDMLAFGQVPPGLFGILQSLAPAMAAVAAWILLGEVLSPGDWIALTAVVVASAGATLTARLSRHGTARP